MNNTEGISKLSGNRAYIISFVIVAVVAAPIVEELIFRGVILRGFASDPPPWLSIGLQGILFGAAHIDPIRGTGNIGLVMILSTVGIVLGRGLPDSPIGADDDLARVDEHDCGDLHAHALSQPVVDQAHVAEPHRDRCRRTAWASSTGASVSGSTRSRWSRRASGSAAMTSAPARIRSSIAVVPRATGGSNGIEAAGTTVPPSAARRRAAVAARHRQAVRLADRRQADDLDPDVEVEHHPSNDGELLEVLLTEHRRRRVARR